MHETKSQLEELKSYIDQGMEKVDLPGKREEVAKLNAEMQAEGFWDDSSKAQEVSQKAANVAKLIETWEGVVGEVEELIGLLPEIHPEQDPEAAEEFREMVKVLGERWRVLEISTFLNGKYDENNTIVTIHAGTGGTDAADFAEMLLRMYLRYAEKAGFKTEILDKSVGEEAGVKSVTFSVAGQFSYGYLKCEGGVHRLVRLSPFNSGGTRETSFVLVEAVPEIHQSDDLNIASEDLRIDTFRAGGHGGQGVNTTDSAVRITHIPTNTVVQCQNQRSQLQNKEQAMKVLHARLVDLMIKQQADELSELKGEVQEIAWGNQIRSYVLHPYKMVKDHRTDYEENNPDKVFDGEIQGFIEAELKKVG
jgi:peptide chain release factor 2